MITRFKGLIEVRHGVDKLAAKDRDAALGELVDHLVTKSVVKKKDRDSVLAELRKREEKGSTGIGGGMAIPHTHFEGVKDIVFAIGRSESGVDFRAIDGMPAKVLFLVVAPEKNQEDYLFLLSSISRVLNNREYRRFITTARSVAAIYETLFEAAQAVLKG